MESGEGGINLIHFKSPEEIMGRDSMNFEQENSRSSPWKPKNGRKLERQARLPQPRR
jgi:hypothetical protein